jgi:hypothetical protein
MLPSCCDICCVTVLALGTEEEGSRQKVAAAGGRKVSDEVFLLFVLRFFMLVHGYNVCLYPILLTDPASHQLAHSGPVTRTLPRLIHRGRVETSPPSVFAVRSFPTMVLVSSGTTELTFPWSSNAACPQAGA